MPTSRPRLRRSDCSSPGIRRVRRGRGFSYLGPSNKRVDTATLARIRELTIPPAWEDVWICLDPRGHLQATGVDSAGRKQYLYHTAWREQRDRRKFADMIAFAQALPGLRKQVAADLDQGDELGRERVLACMVRLLDRGLFRIGGEEYVVTGGSYGLATLTREHVTVRDGTATFDYPAKSGVRRVHVIRDGDCVALLKRLLRRRGPGPELFAFQEHRRWHPLHSDEISRYLKEHAGERFSAKDFRTWNATVLAAVGVAAATRESDRTAKRRQSAIRTVVREVAEVLGNTPAVARRSYIDPRIFDRFLSGWTIDPALGFGEQLERVTDLSERRRRRLELGVLDLLAEVSESPRIEEFKDPRDRSRRR